MALQRYLTLHQAANVLDTSLATLNRMIQSGTIQAVEVAGEVIVSEHSILATRKKEDLPEYKKFEHLAGQAIWVSEAARKYDVPQPTISRWMSKNLIKSLGKDKNRTILDEQDVAYCAEIYQNSPGQGKWLFNPDGTPYVPKTQDEEKALA